MNDPIQVFEGDGVDQERLAREPKYYFRTGELYPGIYMVEKDYSQFARPARAVWPAIVVPKKP